MYKALPEGYYFVGKEYSGVACFAGELYEVREGENWFASINEALEKSNEIPKKLLKGIVLHEPLDAPVLLIENGEYEVERVRINKSV